MRNNYVNTLLSFQAYPVGTRCLQSPEQAVSQLGAYVLKKTPTKLKKKTATKNQNKPHAHTHTQENKKPKQKYPTQLFSLSQSFSVVAKQHREKFPQGLEFRGTKRWRAGVGKVLIICKICSSTCSSN